MLPPCGFVLLVLDCSIKVQVEKKKLIKKKNIYIKTAMNEQAGNEVIWHEFYTYVQNWPVVG